MKYRTDRIEEQNGQQIGYTDWIGGPTISKVHANCPDGQRRWAHITGEPDTFFSIPAYVNNGSAGRIQGWIGSEDGIYYFRADTDNEPQQWRPVRITCTPSPN